MSLEHPAAHSSSKNKFYKSYGLVATTRSSPFRVMLVERRIPYCLQNALLRKLGAVAASVTRRARDPAPETEGGRSRLPEDDGGFLRSVVSETLVACSRDASLYDDEDFGRFERRGVFEDQFDFPRGQMSAKTKRALDEFCRGLRERLPPPAADRPSEKAKETAADLLLPENDEGSGLVPPPTFQFLKKVAGFLTAFAEFEEETGHTFRFDLHTILGSKTVRSSFYGLDGYEYEQKFYFVRVDKFERLFRKRPSPFTFDLGTTAQTARVDDPASSQSNLGSSNRKRREDIFREIDRQTFAPRIVKIEEAVVLLSHQQYELGKRDFKYRLLSLANEPEFFPKNDSEEDEMTESVAESYFFEFVKRVQPDVYKRSVKRVRWREK